MTVPVSIDQVTRSWLNTALDHEVTIRAIERIGEGYGLASEVYRIELSGFTAESVVLKLWPVDSPAGTTEIGFYAHVATSVPCGIPTSLHSAANEAHAVLVLEDIRGRQGDVLEREQASEQRAVATTMGRIHGAFWSDERLDRQDWLRNGWTGPTDEWFADRPRQFDDRFGAVPSSLGSELMAKPRKTFQAGAARLIGLPETLVHGDLHLDNILFADAPVILDWAGCRRGPGMQDLASVIFTMGESMSIDLLLEAYQSGLATEGIEVGLDPLERALGGAVLWSFLFWTLGTAMWIPVDERSVAMQRRHIDDAVRMVEFWAERDPELLERVLG